MANSRKIITPVFRASFVHVITPRRNEQSGKDEYSIKMIFDKDADLGEMKALIKEAIAENGGQMYLKGLNYLLKTVTPVISKNIRKTKTNILQMLKLHLHNRA